MSYHRFKDAEGNEHGSFEVFYNETVGPDFVINPDEPKSEHVPAPVGWYWWACFPGCLPDSEPVGPFGTEKEAIDDAQEFAL